MNTPVLPTSFLGTPANTLMEALHITITVAEPKRIVATMPVAARVHQPFGLLHGGASVALAETVASVGATLNVLERGHVGVGQEINANHLRPVKEGEVTAVATPIHMGRTSHVWAIEIRDEQQKLICISRCTLAIIPLT